MRISHLAIWTYNLEGMRNFYIHYFDASSSEAYYNHSRDFKSYLIKFDGDCSIELMQMPGIPKTKNDTRKEYTGLVHFAVQTGSKQKVDDLTEQLRNDGFSVVGEARTTGDGFYESTILDPDGNRVEIVA
ncbi:VOC family protein [Sunxiuqinia indica]|uniref:VOC family protein n=1 Tax=Sunxiuqinia indica TaxID=2692584 RepID=UPI00135677BF|nr:VOC family protein [Sunxiuqinia indica]